MNSATAGTQPAGTTASVVPQPLPAHIAIIMDGNGRWAERRGFPRIEGHRRGVQSVREIVEECSRLGVEQLTLFCLSSENWKRPPRELSFLMHLLEQYLVEERGEIMQQNIRFTMIGRRDGLPPSVLEQLDKTIALSTANTGTVLCLAINYGARAEIVDAVRRIADDAKAGRLDPRHINEHHLSNALYTAGMRDPDLLIRTAGERRLSNFLLWQISYAELWVTDTCWPEFRREHLHAALQDYAHRDRRFGGLGD